MGLLTQNRELCGTLLLVLLSPPSFTSMDYPTPTPIYGGYDDLPLIPDPSKGFSLPQSPPRNHQTPHSLSMFFVTLIHSIIFSLPFNAIFLVLVLLLTVPFATTLMAHRQERAYRNHRHLYPLDIRSAAHYFVFEDPDKPGGEVYNVYLKGSTRIVYRFSRLQVRWWETPFVERWKLTDKTGFELAEIQRVLRGFKSGLIHFLLPRCNELSSDTVRITPPSASPIASPSLPSPLTTRMSSSPEALNWSAPFSPLIWNSVDSNADVVFLKNYDDDLEQLETMGYSGIESSLRDNALITVDRLGDPVLLDPLSSVEDGHLRDLHNVLVKMNHGLTECKFKLTRDTLCEMTWDTVGNLEKTHKGVSGAVCERVGLFSTVVPDHRIGFRVIFNEEKVDALSAIATGFLQYKNQQQV